MANEDITPESLPEETPSTEEVVEETKGEEGAVEDEGTAAPDAMTLEELNTLTGKSYPTKEAALKSIKDTFSYVGKKQATPAPVADDGRIEALEAKLEVADFYRENPQFDTPDAKQLIADMGGSPAEVVEKASFKTAFEKMTAFDKTEESKSVLQTNPKLGQVTDKITKAKEAVNSGNTSQAGDLAVDAVLEAYPLKK